MSLTNPNKVVTEERLNEYHQTILPFLGGMPDILANKFSRANLYSTDEKMIGRWTDGRPLYQRTVLIEDLTVQSYTDTYIDVSSILDKTVVECKNIIGGFYVDYSGQYRQYHNWGYECHKDGGQVNPYFYTIYYRQAIDSLVIYGTWANLPYTIDKGFATIQYTKTTDSAVEIGLDTDYSTEEKIVGTWIDGKPLYQKTINEVISTYTDSSSRRTFRTSDVILNPDYFALRDWCLGSTKSGTTAFISGCGMTTAATIRRSVEMYIDNNNAKLQAHTLVSDAFTSATIIATIQYTKTTD